MEGREILINRSRVFIDLETYRMVDFIGIVRCFTSQGFGHTSNRCEAGIH